MATLPQTTTGKHRLVITLLATGKYTLKAICEKYNLNYDWMKKVAGSELFQRELARAREKFQDELLAKELEDPAMQALRQSAGRAAEVLVSEMDNYNPDSGASAATRIKAADSILDRIGLAAPKSQEREAAPQVVINISTEKLEKLIPRIKQAEPLPA